MGNSSIFKDYLKYASLNIIGMIGLSCYILADTFFVSRGLGANGLAALNIAIPIYSFINGSGLMFGMGGATRYSIFNGQNDRKKANEVFSVTCILAMALAALFFVAGLLFSGNITRFLGADAVTYEMSKTYLQVILLFAPMFILNNILICFVRNDGQPRLAMFAMLGGSLSNIILDYVFIFPFKMGIFGAVFATGLAPVFSMAILSVCFIKNKNNFHFKKCRLSRQMGLGVVSSGIPSLVTEVSAGVVIIVFNTIILKLSGNMGVAAYGVIANLSLVIIAIYTGIAQGIQPIISQNYGLGNRGNIEKVLRYAITTVIGLSLCIYTAMFFGAHQIAGIFNSERNALLQEIAVRGLKIYFIGCVFAGLNIVLSVYFTSTDVPKPAHIISLLRGFVIILPMAFFLSAIWQMTGVWSAFPATEIIVTVVGLALYKRKRVKAS